MTKLSDEWQTPQDLFDVLDKGGEYMGMKFEGFHFDIDLCADAYNSKCNLYCGDYLNYAPLELLDLATWPGANGSQTFFMNPPYSNPKPCIEKAWEDSKHCRIVCLVKCDPSTQWWSTFWNYGEDHYVCKICGENMQGLRRSICSGKCYIEANGNPNKYNYDIEIVKRGPKPGCEVRFFPKRIQFDPPQQLIDSGEVWDLNNKSDAMQALNETMRDIGRPLKTKWVQKCHECHGKCHSNLAYLGTPKIKCLTCKGKGYVTLSGPTFPSALLIFDRRGLQ